MKKTDHIITRAEARHIHAIAAEREMRNTILRNSKDYRRALDIEKMRKQRQDWARTAEQRRIDAELARRLRIANRRARSEARMDAFHEWWNGDGRTTIAWLGVLGSIVGFILVIVAIVKSL